MAIKFIKNSEKWFPILTRRGAILLTWLESMGFGDKLLEFTELNLKDYKDIRIIQDKEYTIFLEGNIWAKIEEKFRKKLRSDRNYLDRIFKKFYSRLAKLEKFSKLKDLTKTTNSELSNLILTYADLYADIAPFYIVYSAVRPILKKETEDWLKGKVTPDKLQDYHIALTTPLKPLYAVEEDKNLQKIVKTIKANKKIEEFLIKNKNLNKVSKELPKISPKIFQKIKFHLKSYYWVPVERDNPPWEIEDILSRIQYKLRRKIVLKKKESLEQKQKHLKKELKIPKKIMKSFQEMRNFMAAVDAMKKTYAISHCFLSNFLEETARRLKCKKDLLYFLTPNEISKAIVEKKLISNADIQSRECCIVISHRVKRKYKIQIIKGREAKLAIAKLQKTQMIEEKEIIEGIPVSPGKIIGVAKILKDANEVEKLSQDEILVTPMTTPDYIVAIHKAAAIVTDEGGVLCHAAIVSREFGIPCVIGTRIATKALRDGDLVEVDAVKGIVRILKRVK